jgi:hypothetical protein
MTVRWPRILLALLCLLALSTSASAEGAWVMWREVWSPVHSYETQEPCKAGAIIVEPAQPERQRGVTITTQDYLILREGGEAHRLETRMYTCLGIGVSCILSALALHATGQYFNGHEPILKAFIFTIVFWAGGAAGLALAGFTRWDRRRAQARTVHTECRRRIEETLNLNRA